jgi:phosphoribosyl 1,2-cyclic phosphodiesterase
MVWEPLSKMSPPPAFDRSKRQAAAASPAVRGSRTSIWKEVIGPSAPLRYRTHPSHFSLAEALDWIDKLAPKRAVLTHMHVPLDYSTVLAETPPHVEPAYDGLVLEVPCEVL